MKNKKINWGQELGTAGKCAVSASFKFLQVLMNILITVLLICALTGIIVATAFTVYIKNYVNTSIDLEQFQMNMVQETTTSRLYKFEFTDRTNRIGEAVEIDGEKIIGTSDSIYVTYDQIPENMINAVIAIEDKRFRTHEGVDWKRTFGAALVFFNGTDGYGGSSITQQLVKNVTGEDDYSIQRKVQEIFWALDLETKMDKEQILEMYLNIVNFGGSYYGVQAAAHNYFNKDVSELSLIECAAIAGITQNPSKYNPIIHPENNAQRRDTVLQEMYDQGLITQREYDDAFGHELKLNIPSTNDELTEQQQKGINSWYTDMVIDDVISDLMAEKGYSRQVASLMVYNGGLKIYTLIDEDVQAQLEKVFLDDSNFREAGAQFSSIVIDPYTGDILGVVGARGEKYGNRLQSFATQTRRPSGSAIKPLSVYAPSIDSGLITWSTVTDDTPFDFTTSETGWPKNDELWGGNKYRGLTNTSFALTYSLNTVAVKLLDKYGVQKSFDFCYNTLKLTHLTASAEAADGSIVSDICYSALALGQLNYGISLRQLASAYSIFPNMGIYNESHSYLKVTDAEGNEILTSNYNGTVAISEETACVMNHILERVVNEGTASQKWLGAANGIKMTYDKTGISVAGKTGSAGENYDRWFIGYTPYYICGVWCGYEYNNKQITIANPTLPVWDAIMIPLHEGIRQKRNDVSPTFDESSNVVQCDFCRDSGLLATDACALDPRGSRLETGYFIDGTQPTEYCETHVLVNYDVVTGCIACDDCPSSYVRQVALVRVNRDFDTARDLTIQDAQYTYVELPYDVMPYTDGSYPYYYNLALRTEEKAEKGEEGETLYTYHGTGYTCESKWSTVKPIVHYNRICTEHFNLENWKLRMAAEDARRGIVRSSAVDSSSVESSAVESSALNSGSILYRFSSDVSNFRYVLSSMLEVRN